MYKTFDRYKNRVITLAKRAGRGHLVPGDNELFRCYEANTHPEWVVKYLCTIEWFQGKA